MDTIEKNNLKKFIEDNFDFYGLKKAGFFKNIRKNEYEKIAARVCHFFSYESIYEYGKYKPCDRPGCNTGFAHHFKKDCPHITRTNIDICRNTKGWEPLEINIVEICMHDRYKN